MSRTEKQRNKERYRKIREESNFHDIVKIRLTQASARAKKKKQIFNLTEEYITELFSSQKGLCYYSKIPMNWTINDPHSFSIDRIDSTKGYTEDNTVLCSASINLIKFTNSTQQLKLIVQKITENIQNIERIGSG